jgi:surface antigen
MENNSQASCFLTQPGKVVPILSFMMLLLPAIYAGHAYADPPPWASAHGYRDRQDQGDDERDYRRERRHDDEDEGEGRERYRGRDDEGAPYIPPYGIERGTCDREAVGQILGGVTGAAIGSTVGHGGENAAAIIGGAIVGVIVGGTIGRAMDNVDQGCVGQVLEHAPDGRRVAWYDAAGRTQYQVTPGRPYKDDQGRYCRAYTTNSVGNGSDRRARNTACRDSSGTWQKID